jgi:hypothetical protein
LGSQHKRTDNVGELARRASREGGAPAGDATYEAWQAHLRDRGAGEDALDALAEGWDEFKGGTRPEAGPAR